jgi:hypothetical protein
MVDELLVASAADAFTAEFISVSPFTVLVSIFPSAELKPIRGLISDRLTRRLFGILAFAEISPPGCEEVDNPESVPTPDMTLLVFVSII